MKKLFAWEVEAKGRQFLDCTSLEDLKALGFDANQIVLMAMRPPYYTFELRKASGGLRLIEAPEEGLKELQRQFNFYLQSVYYGIQSEAAYGFIIRVRDRLPTKNILENARCHLGAKYMLNVDFKAFFHQIQSWRIRALLQHSPFQFNAKTANILARLFTRKQRLPMGAPTSPVLSNFILLDLDTALLDWARQNNIRYTRFVDDLTFSSQTEVINQETMAAIDRICRQHRFQLNPAKCQYYEAKDLKKVTGLVLKERVEIDTTFFLELNQNLIRLKHLIETSLLLHQHLRTPLTQNLKKVIDGQINFIGQIEGYGSQRFHHYRAQLQQALDPDEQILSARWTNNSYF